MSEFGFPPFPGGFGRFPAPPPPPPPPPGASRGLLAAILIITCILLGVTLAWGLKFRSENARLDQRNRSVENAYTVVLAKRNDFVGFLTDPRTHLLRLSGKGAAAGRTLTIAWLEEKHSGLMIGENIPLLPDKQTYTLWRTSSEAPVPLADFKPDSQLTLLDFTDRYSADKYSSDKPRPATQPALAPAQFIITLGKDRNATGPGTPVYVSIQ